MPRTGYFIAVVTAVICAAVMPWPAGAQAPTPDPGAQEPDAPYWTCSASTARVTLLDGDPIPPVDPLGANLEREECAEDLGGLPDIQLPPAPDPAPVVTTTTAQARTQILCATDDPDPLVTPENNEDCDAGRPAFEQQVLSTANVEDLQINLGSGPSAIQITAEAANTSARARCTNGVPVLSSTSNFLNLVVRIGGIVIPIQIPNANEEAVIDLGIAKLTLNELVGTEGAYPDNAEEGSVTRRALHLEVPGGTEPLLGSVADVVVAESTADFHGDVCPEGKIVVKKETVPDQNPNTTNFPFTSPTLTPTSFNLTDDGQQVFNEVTPGVHPITETAAPGQYSLAAINCVENRTENTTSSVATRTATVSVAPGETVTCVFINAVCPPGSSLNNNGECVILTVVCPPGSTGPNQQGQCVVNTVTCPPGSTGPNQQGQCIVNTVTCPPGSTLNGQGQCIINATQCPTGSSRPDPNGPCVVTNIICPPGSTGPNANGQCVNNTITCPPGSTGPNGSGQCVTNATTCPTGSSQVNGQCVVNQPNCPAGTARNPQGQCVITSVQCPAGTTFNPTTVGCTEAPRGGTLVPINQQVANLFRTSPCIGQGFGPLVAILGTNGPDRITGTNTSDRIFALGGNDRVSGGRGDDCVEGGSGRDVLDGSNGNDFLLGGSGNDQVNGGPGRDRFSGGSGRDVMSGGSGNDRMTGGGGRDRLNGGYGNDTLRGGSGNDGIHTGNGRDRVFGGPGNDVINAATRGPAAFVDCGSGSKDRVRINRNEVRRIRNCEFVDVPRRIRSNNRVINPR